MNLNNKEFEQQLLVLSSIGDSVGVKNLLDQAKGLNIEITSEVLESMAVSAGVNCEKNVLVLLASYNVDVVNAKDGLSFVYAILKGDLSLLQWMIEQGVNDDVLQKSYYRCELISSKSETVEFIRKAWLEREAKLIDTAGDTPRALNKARL